MLIRAQARVADPSLLARAKACLKLLSSLWERPVVWRRLWMPPESPVPRGAPANIGRFAREDFMTFKQALMVDIIAAEMADEMDKNVHALIDELADEENCEELVQSENEDFEDIEQAAAPAAAPEAATVPLKGRGRGQARGRGAKGRGNSEGAGSSTDALETPPASKYPWVDAARHVFTPRAAYEGNSEWQLVPALGYLTYAHTWNALSECGVANASPYTLSGRLLPPVVLECV